MPLDLVIRVVILFNFQLPVFKEQEKLETHTLKFGGDSRIRTGDMLLAKQPLYQLSYIPTRDLVGVDGIEPSTSSLSGTRSNQLSYTPMCLRKRNGTECLNEFHLGAEAPVSLERR